MSKKSNRPVKISDEATRALAYKMREWSGWKDSRLVFDASDKKLQVAKTEHESRTFTANPETLVLNPNRVLNTVTPFRLRQEAVLSGALLHEAGHARHSHWRPRTQAAFDTMTHADGTPVTKAELGLAVLMEEPRIESLIAADAVATDLNWTMRAAAAHILPDTKLMADPNQMIIDLIGSWALRAGREIGLAISVGRAMPNWVNEFTALVHAEIMNHLSTLSSVDDPAGESGSVLIKLTEMIRNTDDTGPTMLDTARDVLRMLFPETPDEQMPQAGSGCQSETGMSGEGGKSDDAGEKGEGNTEPEDEGSGDDPGAGDSGSESGDGNGSDSDSDSGEQEAEDSGGGSETSKDSPESEGEAECTSELAEALSEMEKRARKETQAEAKAESKGQPSGDGGSGASGSGKGGAGGGWRKPTKAEREMAKNAEQFLRDQINPSEKAHVVLSESPSATVDPAALAEWKAGGQQRDPMFFRRTRREVEPSPPVKVAILVDVSGSMDSLQKPSALLSWALASAALDLRNFAGRGTQVESCLIHWGSSARVIQHNGQTLPGIREVNCTEGTWKMDRALELVEDEMPGFFDLPANGRASNRLLVQFTDWELFDIHAVSQKIGKALASGVNMLTVAPYDYSPRRSKLDDVLYYGRNFAGPSIGTSSVLRYNTMAPEAVWDHAAETMR